MLIGLSKMKNLVVFSIKEEKKKRPLGTFLAAVDKNCFQFQLSLNSRWLFQ